MLKKVFCKQTGLADIREKPLEFGNFLMEKVISISGRYRYEELFESIARSKFSLDYLLED